MKKKQSTHQIKSNQIKSNQINGLRTGVSAGAGRKNEGISDQHDSLDQEKRMENFADASLQSSLPGVDVAIAESAEKAEKRQKLAKSKYVVGEAVKKESLLASSDSGTHRDGAAHAKEETDYSDSLFGLVKTYSFSEIADDIVSEPTSDSSDSDISSGMHSPLGSAEGAPGNWRAQQALHGRLNRTSSPVASLLSTHSLSEKGAAGVGVGVGSAQASDEMFHSQLQLESYGRTVDIGGTLGAKRVEKPAISGKARWKRAVKKVAMLEKAFFHTFRNAEGLKQVNQYLILRLLDEAHTARFDWWKQRMGPSLR